MGDRFQVDMEQHFLGFYVRIDFKTKILITNILWPSRKFKKLPFDFPTKRASPKNLYFIEQSIVFHTITI